MLHLLKEKPFLLMAGGIAVIGLVLVKNRGNQEQQDEASEFTGEVRPRFENARLYIPTTEYNIEWVEGNKTVDNSINKDLPKVTIPNESKPTPPKVTTPAKPSKPAPKPSQKVVTHKVAKGETLWGIAKKYYGDGQKYKKIAKDNNIKDPNKIKVGQTIKIIK